MANEMMPALSGEVDRNERYNKAPNLFSQAGQVDRQHEGQHVVTIRDADRRARELVASAAVEAIGDVAWIEGRAKVNSEAKYAVHRAQRESQIIADGDPVLQAKFGLLDDDNFQEVRSAANRPRPTSPGIFS
jgi:hypothetical protein